MVSYSNDGHNQMLMMSVNRRTIVNMIKMNRTMIILNRKGKKKNSTLAAMRCDAL
uniref:Uncharacterized protein n=1 Tax=Octopus bimaculoides TaxID=37653 RepID=A0A0L8II21_OCTBM